MRTSSAACQFFRWAPLATVLIVVLPVVATAQEPATSFDQLKTRLKPGDTVWVTDTQWREFKGRITSLAPDSLGLDANGATTFPADQVRFVQKWSHDSLKYGALIGLGAGLGVTAALIAGICSSEHCEFEAGGTVAVFALFGGIGAGIGAGVGALIPGRKQIVYRAPGASGSARLSFAPVLTPRAKGVAVSISF